MAAYIEHCALLEPGRCSAELQKAAGQEAEPRFEVPEGGKPGGQTAYPTSLKHAFLMSSPQALQQPGGMSAGDGPAGPEVLQHREGGGTGGGRRRMGPGEAGTSPRVPGASLGFFRRKGFLSQNCIAQWQFLQWLEFQLKSTCCPMRVWARLVGYR